MDYNFKTRKCETKTFNFTQKKAHVINFKEEFSIVKNTKSALKFELFCDKCSIL